MPQKKVLNFAFPSLSREGLTNFVTRIGQDLFCSCEAKLYKPDEYVCSHMFDVRLGESAPPEEKPEIDVLLGILNELGIFVLSQNGQESSIFVPGQDVEGVERAVTISSTDAQEAVIGKIGKEGYRTIGIFFDPIARNRGTLKRIKQGYTKSLGEYLSRSVRNNIACLEQRHSYGVVDIDDLENVLRKDSKRFTPASLVRAAVNELKSIEDCETLEEESIGHTKAALKEMTKSYWYTDNIKEAIIDTDKHTKRRKTKEIDFMEKTMAEIGTIRRDKVLSNIEKGLFLRTFLQKCYGQLGGEIPGNVYHLPTHQLEKIYEKAAGKEMRTVKLFSYIAKNTNMSEMEHF